MCWSNICVIPAGPSAASTHVEDLFEYVAQTPLTPVITGTFTFSLNFLWFISLRVVLG